MKLTWTNFKGNILYFLSRPFTMFFFEQKQGVYQFSTKKMWAFLLTALAVANHAHLHIDPASHWISTLKKVDSNIIIAMIASLDGLAGWALKVYKDGKKEGAV